MLEEYPFVIDWPFRCPHLGFTAFPAYVAILSHGGKFISLEYIVFGHVSSQRRQRPTTMLINLFNQLHNSPNAHR